MKVKDLIAKLGEFDPELDVVYPLHSEQCIADPEDVQIIIACPARPDGWVQNKRPDKPSQNYLCIG